jgi:AraC family transcriptional regulator
MDGGNGSTSSRSKRSANQIRVEIERVPSDMIRSAARERGAERTLRVLAVSGRDPVLNGGALPPMVLVPLRGSVRISDGEGTRTLRAGRLIVAEAGQFAQVVGGSNALWIAVVAPSSLWRQLLSAARETPITEPVLMPAVHDANHAIRRAVVRLVRHATRTGSSKSETAIAAQRFAMLLGELQSTFDPLIRKCPGRTLAQRRGVFLRLQRVYNGMESSSAVDVSVRSFARVANYSTCHFVRTFSAVYGETPYAVLMERKLHRAFRLVHETELSITEVARAAGFEDRCAFARSFKRRFGRTATEVRSRTAAVAG